MPITFRRYLSGGRTINAYETDEAGYDPVTDPLEQGRVKPGDELTRFQLGRSLKYIRSADNSEWELVGWDWLPGKPAKFPALTHERNGPEHSGLEPITNISGHIPGEATHIAVMFRAWRLAQRIIKFK